MEASLAGEAAHAELVAALDALIERFGAPAFHQEILRAREQLDASAGKLFDDDELYEQRNVAFLEWYVVERPLATHARTPAQLALLERPDDATLLALARSHRSLFSVEDLGAGRVLLHDLLGGALFEVAEPRRLAGVTRGDLVEARLFAYLGQPRFGRTFLYHPAGAREAILGHARRMAAEGKRRTEVVDFVTSLRVRALRYRHVAPERVYEAGMAEIR